MIAQDGQHAARDRMCAKIGRHVSDAQLAFRVRLVGMGLDRGVTRPCEAILEAAVLGEITRQIERRMVRQGQQKIAMRLRVMRIEDEGALVFRDRFVDQAESAQDIR